MLSTRKSLTEISIGGEENAASPSVALFPLRSRLSPRCIGTRVPCRFICTDERCHGRVDRESAAVWSKYSEKTAETSIFLNSCLKQIQQK